MTLQLSYVAHSEIGLIRKNNQDSGYASPHLLIVADGMGGAAAGDLASAVAIDTIRKIDSPTAGEDMLEVLALAIHQANDKIADLVDSDLSLEGMCARPRLLPSNMAPVTVVPMPSRERSESTRSAILSLAW